MLRFFKFTLKKHPLISSAVLVLLLGVIVLMVRMMGYFNDFWAHPPFPHKLEPWMSPRMIEHAWDLDKGELFKLLELDMEADPKTLPKTIGDYALEHGMNLGEIEEKLDSLHKDRTQND